MEVVKYVKDMFGIVEGSIVDTVVDVGLGAVPMLGEAYQTYRIKKLEERMNANEPQLILLKNKIERSENDVFYKREVFPLIVKQLMNDDEDKKAKVIIDGFEYVVDNELNEIEQIYYYYDVLSELRYSDMLFFVDKYMPFEMKKNPNLNINLAMSEDMNKTERKKLKEKEAIENYQTNKLLRLGLIIDDMLSTNDDGVLLLDANKFYDSRTKLSDFGKQFLEIFSL